MKRITILISVFLYSQALSAQETDPSSLLGYQVSENNTCKLLVNNDGQILGINEELDRCDYESGYSPEIMEYHNQATGETYLVCECVEDVENQEYIKTKSTDAFIPENAPTSFISTTDSNLEAINEFPNQIGD